eukprot:1539047-Prymnesium_polylepis.1
MNTHLPRGAGSAYAKLPPSTSRIELPNGARLRRRRVWFASVKLPPSTWTAPPATDASLPSKIVFSAIARPPTIRSPPP